VELSPMPNSNAPRGASGTVIFEAVDFERWHTRSSLRHQCTGAMLVPLDSGGTEKIEFHDAPNWGGGCALACQSQLIFRPPRRSNTAGRQVASGTAANPKG